MFIEETMMLLEHRANMIASRMTETQQASHSEIIDLMILQIVNKYEYKFRHFRTCSEIHPEILYQSCIDLYAEMSTFTNDRRRPNQVEEYHHHEINQTFNQVKAQVRESLNIVLQQNSTEIKLEQKEYGLWLGKIKDTTLLDSDNLILSVFTSSRSDDIRTYFPSQIKIAPAELINDFVSRALPGIEIECLTVAPRQIPYHTKCTYFSLSKNSSYWNLIKDTGRIAFHTAGRFKDLKLELWAIKG